MAYCIEFTTFRLSKKKLLERLKPISNREFVRLVNPVIAAGRNCKLTEASKVKFMRSNEVLELLAKIGEPPEDYGSKIILDSSRLYKFEVKHYIPYLSEPEFRKAIFKVIMQKRKIDFNEAKNVKVLNTNEVLSSLEMIGEKPRMVTIDNKIYPS